MVLDCPLLTSNSSTTCSRLRARVRLSVATSSAVTACFPRPATTTTTRAFGHTISELSSKATMIPTTTTYASPFQLSPQTFKLTADSALFSLSSSMSTTMTQSRSSWVDFSSRLFTLNTTLLDSAPASNSLRTSTRFLEPTSETRTSQTVPKAPLTCPCLCLSPTLCLSRTACPLSV